jgi:(5-formylfuran-3-yl)methyl phosphate synthase
MRLLVSVTDAEEAAAALAGGADVIDAKDPYNGPLGAVSPDVFREIRRVVADARPVTAAIGDATDEVSVEAVAREFAATGAALLKVGFAGIDSRDRIAALIAAAVRGAAAASDGRSGIVAVAYADQGCGDCIGVPRLLGTAARAGARGVLVDTMDKAGPGLCHLATPLTVARWVADAHDVGLTVALAGRLTAEELAIVRDAGADVAGVRGAACVGGRAGRVSADRVRELVHVIRASTLART